MPKLETKPLSWFKPDPNQPRKHFDEAELRLLGESLKLRQNDPVQAMPDGTIIEGERRFRAAKLVGLEKLDVIITDRALSPDELAVIRLTTFLHRVGLKPYEEWRAFEEALEQNPTWDQKTLAQKLGLDESTICRKRSPGKCIPAVQDALRDDKIGIAHCYTISKCKTPEEQAGLLALKLSGATRDTMEAQGRRKRAEQSEEEPPEKSARIRIPLAINTDKLTVNGTVTVASLPGKEIDLDAARDLLTQALKALDDAKKRGITAKTFARAMKDIATAAG